MTSGECGTGLQPVNRSTGLPCGTADKCGTGFQPVSYAVLLCVALVSAALIAYEITLMRRLLIERWHHFGYLVISVALLGFGISGTLLALLQRRVRARPMQTLWWSAAGFAAALLVLPRVAAALPVTARFIPDDLWRQAGWWSLYWTLAAIPFLLGAAHIGGALMSAGSRVGRVYAVNLFGSAVGAVAGGLLVSRFPVEYAAWPSLVLSLLAAAWLSSCRDRGIARRRPVARIICTSLLILLTIAVEAAAPPELAYDEYKEAARIERLVAQGSARRVARSADPHGYVEIHESKLFHGLPFLALTKSPPPMFSVTINGDPAGSIFRIDRAAQADVMDRTLTAFPYRLVPPRPRVLLLGETGGTNVWLARRQHAEHIVVVQPNAALVKLLRGPLAESSGRVISRRDVSVCTEDPRAFLTRKRKALPYDVIQIVSLEGLGIGSTGMRGLAEDHLATVEGFAACLRRLSPDGALSICRGIQTPQRENIRLLTTLVAALESLGVEDASRHIAQVRDYLGVCTLALKSPLDAQGRETLREAIRAFNLTPVWYAGLPPEEVNQPDALDGPAGSSVDWLHQAATEVFSPRREAFYDAWLTNVRPPHDDNPFFWDFYKPEALPILRQAYGDLWLTRVELGRLFLYTSLLIATATAILLVLAPLALAGFLARRLARRAAAPTSPPSHLRTFATVLYFAAIGVGFMAIEMALISRAIRLLGDPVIASAAVIGGVLVLSGLGSLTSAAPAVRRRLNRGLWLAPLVVAALACAMLSLAWASPKETVSAWQAALLLVVCTVPLAFCMGIPMPGGIAALDQRAPALVPWAWGVNGVASVIGTSLALVVAMGTGYGYVVALAAGLYVLAGLAGWRLVGAPPIHGWGTD